jgi:hypothetical protein
MKGNFMRYESDDEIKSLIERFENCTVTEKEFGHPEHLTVGLWYALDNDFETATGIVRRGIFKVNEAHAVPNTDTSGYHETLTVFWMRTVWNFLEKHKGEKTLATLANELINACGDSRLPLKFYSRELLFSAEARRSFIEPDLQSFS